MLTSLADLEPGTWHLVEATPRGMKLTDGANGAAVTHLAVRTPTGISTLVPICPTSPDPIRVEYRNRDVEKGSNVTHMLEKATHIVCGTLLNGGILIPAWAYRPETPIWMWDQKAEAPTVFPAISLQAHTGQEIMLKLDQGHLQMVPPRHYDFTESQAAPTAEDLRLTPPP